MLTVFESKKYKKSLKVYTRQKDFSISELEKVITTIQKGISLDIKYRDHKLKGELAGMRECHVRPDILLIYQVLERESILILVNIGSHSKLKLTS